MNSKADAANLNKSAASVFGFRDRQTAQAVHGIIRRGIYGFPMNIGVLRIGKGGPPESVDDSPRTENIRTVKRRTINIDAQKSQIAGFMFFCLTSKMSHGGKWRGSGASRNRDIYRSWLHRFVRLIFHFSIKPRRIHNATGRMTSFVAALMMKYTTNTAGSTIAAARSES